MDTIQRYNKRMRNISPMLWRTIAHIEELKGQWIAGARLSPQALGRLKKSVLITSTGASTRIEGAKLSDEEVERLMRGLKTRKSTDRDEQEVRGYYELLERVFEGWKRMLFSEDGIKRFHQDLLQYVKKDAVHRGKYKTEENRVVMVDPSGKSVGVLFEATPPHYTSQEMWELIAWTSRALGERVHHPLLVIGNFIVEFLAIHPFQDGNGRISRALTNLLLLKEGYEYMPYVSHEKLIEDNKPEYYVALRTSQKTFIRDHAPDFNPHKKETIEPWLAFFFSVLEEQAAQAVELLSKENIEKILSQKQLLVWAYIESVPEATPGEIARHTGVVRPTVNQALDALLRLKKIERIGLGRSTRYKKR